MDSTFLEKLQEIFNTSIVPLIDQQVAEKVAQSCGSGFFMTGLTVFVLAGFIGYYVTWKVTPALYAPLMSVANAISSIIIVGAIIAAGPALFSFSKVMGFFAVILATINLFGGFVITNRMLEMFSGKKKPKQAEKN